MIVYRSFRYRIHPTAEQVARLAQWSDALRALWNAAHEQRLMGYRKPSGYRRYSSAIDQINQLKEARAAFPWLADVPRNASAQLLIDLDKAWQWCFKRLGREPRWKRKDYDAISVVEPHPDHWRLRGNQLTFAKLGNIRTVAHRPLQGKPKTCTLKRDGDQWFCLLMCEIEISDVTKSTKPSVGIDRGCINLLADSNGRIVENPRHLKRAQRRLARTQRAICRRKKGSKNRVKAVERLRRIHRKIRRQRDHVLHCESKRYANSHGIIAIEELQIQNMILAGGGRASSIGSAGWASFASMLKYKSPATGAAVVEVPAHYTSQTCAECGAVDKESRNGERYQCTTCGHTAHADVNAARNILSRGTHGASLWRRKNSRPAKQELHVVRRGTRRKPR